MPAERRLYDRLGVSPNASPEDIKRAYKRLALKHHPDRGGDAKAFQDLSSAYEVLSDQDRRAQYDRLGDEGYEQAQQIQPRERTGADQVVFDLFRSFFAEAGGFANLFGARHSAPVKASISVTLEDVFMGSIKTVSIKRTSPCESCVSGETPGPACRACEGSGVRVRRAGGPGFLQVQMACKYCQGRGWLSRGRCSLCHGSGQREEHEVLQMQVQAGMDDGSVVPFLKDGRPCRDLLGIIKVQPHPRFLRHGDDLHVVLQISLADALTGRAARLRHLDGRELRVHGTPGKVIKPGSVQHIRGEGMPKMGSSQRGDLCVKFEVAFPDALDADGVQELISALQRLQKAPQAGMSSSWPPQREQSRL